MKTGGAFTGAGVGVGAVGGTVGELAESLPPQAVSSKAAIGAVIAATAAHGRDAPRERATALMVAIIVTPQNPAPAGSATLPWIRADAKGRGDRSSTDYRDRDPPIRIFWLLP